MWYALPPAFAKYPPATRSPFGSTAKAPTNGPKTSDIPDPSADQLMPFQRAMRLALTPPAVVNPPPATTSPLGVVARARTQSFTPEPSPEPSADQLVPFQRAMRLALTPPAVVNEPPA